MCGIIGIVGRAPVSDRLVDALRRLEYRGYDSAGIATLCNSRLDRRRASGKLRNLEAVLEKSPLEGLIGIGHTRWATHGAPTEANAHPHLGAHVAVVHNGIIENFKELRDALIKAGHSFSSDTDTEVIAHLLSDRIARGLSPHDAVKDTLDQLEGAFALAILINGEDRVMFGARRGSPLVVGYGEGESYLGSDAIALAGLTNRICYLEEGDWVQMSNDTVQIFDMTGAAVERPVTLSAATGALVDKGNHRHFMLKEIYEQPTVVGQTLSSYIDPLNQRIVLQDLCFDPKTISRITLIACGTSYYAAMVAKYWIEHYAHIPVDVDIASEFRYRAPVLSQGGLAVFISQSGETADTLAALRHCKQAGQTVAAIVNVPESTMAREADMVFPIHAGPEIGVASTKAFTCQLSVLAALAIGFGVLRKTIDRSLEATLVQALSEVPSRMAEVLHHDEKLRDIAADLANARDVLYLGRGTDYPIALEGALKLKEISYIHAEGYAAGELKHGPIALIDQAVPIVVIAPMGPLFEKTVSNMEEAIARGGKVILMSCKDGLKNHSDMAVASIELPQVHPMATPLLYALPVQLLAYHTAVHKGTDVDQPRNLAKSVTVE
ncbi:glutamine--fructose-6-phosphate aminotransferase [isomerizing] [Iodidimonas gelatinilytica]|uniref:Glutamine--fructose-6-phosphate aminotransferase [isomerizing] n=1 Tax=Iodidimonas gelatinilytica TaxID=1236966 RepID=A0A5A7N2J6_9PROT|nr:glutamine--fructose-6-phosphate transaminase (isomerizing) [Iodidimonas gelatinilytica]GER02217.1 glutamine--fructose-6-phosphate aminotransferase [isomerizing] [Iodidimonas gelatinilytica]